MKKIGKQLGPYKIIKPIGQGSMGVVFAAKHALTDKQVAIKVATKSDVSKLNQLRREIRSLAKLKHPGVIQVIEHGISEGLPWYAMERLTEPTLANTIVQIWSHQHGSRTTPTNQISLRADYSPEATQISLEDIILSDNINYNDNEEMIDIRNQAAAGQLDDILTLIYGICEVLAYVHGLGIIHRDLKPDNVFILKNKLPVLVDFGLVTQVRGTIGREVIENAQVVSGSPHFMAPEQIRNETLDARCDLYSLGCILYELVTSLKPFSGSRAQIFHAHLERIPLKPSNLVHGVPKALDDLIMALLAKEVNRRIGYAETVLQALEDLGTQRPQWPSAIPSARAYLYRASFIENARVSTDIESHLRRVKKGAGQILVVMGESGLGKTRLGSEMAKKAQRSGMEVVCCECAAKGGDNAQSKPISQPLYPFLQLLDQVADNCMEGGEASFQTLCGKHAAVLCEYSSSIKELPWTQLLPAPPKLEQEQAITRLFEALRSVLAAYSKICPLLVILDDLQWADGLTLAFIKYLSEYGLDDAPVLLLGTMRSEERTQEINGILSADNVKEVSLARMDIRDIKKLASGMLTVSQLPHTFAEFLFERSNGNPFFIAEYLRTAITERVLCRDQTGKWAFADQALFEFTNYESLLLPDTISDLIELRLARLKPIARKVVDCAALIGRHFETDLIASVKGLTEETVGQVIDELVERQILETDDKDGFRFLHDKIREVAEAQLTSERQRELHSKIARQLDKLRNDAKGQQSNNVRLGHHWACAQVPDKAAQHLRLAADQAHRHHAIEEALQLNQRALLETQKARRQQPERKAHWDRETITANEALAALHSLKRDYEPARNALRQALDQKPGDFITKARLNRLLGKTFETEHRHKEALAAYSEAERLLNSDPAPSCAWGDELIEVKLGRLWTHYWAANSHLMGIEISETQALIKERGTPRHLYQFYLTQIFRDLRRDRYRVKHVTVKLGRQLLKAAVDADMEFEASFAQFELGFLLLFAGKLTEAKQVLLKALEQTKQIGDTSGEVRTLCYYVILMRRMGNIDKTEILAHKLLKSAVKAKMTDYIGIAHASLGWVYLKRGNVDLASVQTRKAREIWATLPFDYSMKWTAVLTELKIAFDARDLEKLCNCAKILRHKVQLWLPDQIDVALSGIITGFTTKDDRKVFISAKEALLQAETLGFL
ncbi:protein kinase domain-containing protein [Flexibacterium corallicola]|uniref:protein kinase domain-containing protein n=1 Tax=Flexibacterium corallicola TaxID=3037259 RepID=UPI00286EBC25|nr:protein kinase [Pseudovibrio sp. M1P-2-3]